MTTKKFNPITWLSNLLDYLMSLIKHAADFPLFVFAGLALLHLRFVSMAHNSCLPAIISCMPWFSSLSCLTHLSLFLAPLLVYSSPAKSHKTHFDNSHRAQEQQKYIYSRKYQARTAYTVGELPWIHQMRYFPKYNF